MLKEKQTKRLTIVINQKIFIGHFLSMYKALWYECCQGRMRNSPYPQKSFSLPVGESQIIDRYNLRETETNTIVR
jgi:hypothetical protein